MRAVLAIAALALIACDGRAGNAAPSPPDLTAAQRLAQAAGARGEAPSGDYHCVLLDPDRGPVDLQPYGDLSVRGDAYRLRLAGGRVLSGHLHSTPAGRLIWNGPLGPMDSPPRQISRAMVTSADDTVTLWFDFAPPLPGPPPTTRVACMMSVPSSI
jgi:hypothetical protein